MTALLDVADLGVQYRVPSLPWRPPLALHAVHNVSLTIAPGEILGVVGESGSGKTSLGRAILRLLPVSSGAVHFAGRRIDGLSGRQLAPVRRRMQAVFQDPTSSLNPTMTVGAAVGEGLAIYRIGDRAERPERVAAMLERVGLPRATARNYPGVLSGGQRQRVGIARALIIAPDLLIADEAVSALDVSVQAGIINLLLDLRDEMGLAMLFIAHDLDIVRHSCDRVMVLYLGRVMETGRTTDVFANPRHPYTRALVDSVPRLMPASGQRRLLVGDPPSPLTPPSGCVFRTRCRHAESRCAEVVPPLEADADGHAAACIRQHEV